MTCPHPLAGSPPDDPLILRRSRLNHRGLLGARTAVLRWTVVAKRLHFLRHRGAIPALASCHPAPTHAMGETSSNGRPASATHIRRVAALTSPAFAARPVSRRRRQGESPKPTVPNVRRHRQGGEQARTELSGRGQGAHGELRALRCAASLRVDCDGGTIHEKRVYGHSVDARKTPAQNRLSTYRRGV